jgi:hypothetical protein
MPCALLIATVPELLTPWLTLTRCQATAMPRPAQGDLVLTDVPFV